MSEPGTARVELDWDGRRQQIECQWLGRPGAALLVFLHEGLGSVSMWRDFPAQLCAAAGCRGLVFSRPGYGRSTPDDARRPFGADYMHRQAWELLPRLFEALDIDPLAQPVWLVGHSDGGSIALLYAARFPDQVAGAIVLAPHVMVEDLSVASIDKARAAYLETDLAGRLARHHDDADAVFWRWNRIWLSPQFRSWSIEGELSSIRCPLLAVQGLDDEYGTLEQIHRIARCVPGTQLLEIAACGHSAHRDQPQALIAAAAGFVHRHLEDRRAPG